MTDEQPVIGPALDPAADLVLAVRGDNSATAPDYELPPTVPLDTASEILGIPVADGRKLAKTGGYHALVKVIPVGRKFVASTAGLIQAVGLDKVREVLRPPGEVAR
ncbi:hypothetical protein ACIQWA_39880 [Kitasatospora sp. NPDC098652]|uniref:hypothetical protein n=1 Tax=Kitasatospora sp. NPDC098652 TaxID=3364095 RepID=UPI0037F14C98